MAVADHFLTSSQKRFQKNDAVLLLDSRVANSGNLKSGDSFFCITPSTISDEVQAKYPRNPPLNQRKFEFWEKWNTFQIKVQKSL